MSKKNAWRGTAFAKKPAVIATEIALAMMASQYAYAQAVQTAERVERVEVTGSRLPQANAEGVSPVTVINAYDMKLDGLSKPEDLLNNLPQVFATQGGQVSNGASGTANVNLRNLGVNRNLVLINGRRLPPGTPQNGSTSYAADLNQIPAPLIERVELLTGGASAVYGSDAISGVVNFIMNDKFEGIQFDLNHSFYNHEQQNPRGIADIIRGRGATNPSQFFLPNNVTSDGDVHNVSMLLGKNFADNKGNATLFFNYKVEDPIFGAARDWSSCAVGQSNVMNCGGSSTSFPGRFTRADTFDSRTPTDAQYSPVRVSHGSVQLRPDELQPASVRTVRVQRLRAPRCGAGPARVCRVRVSRQPHRFASRPRRHVLRRSHVHDPRRQSAPFRSLEKLPRIGVTHRHPGHLHRETQR